MSVKLEDLRVGDKVRWLWNGDKTFAETGHVSCIAGGVIDLDLGHGLTCRFDVTDDYYAPEFASMEILGLSTKACEGVAVGDGGQYKFSGDENSAQNVAKAAEGIKFDAGKPRMELLPFLALTEEAKVMTFGAQKYADHNWRKGMSWTRVMAAGLRHVFKFIMGEDVDPETGLSHLAHARCCFGFVEEYRQLGLGTDDRWKAPKA